MCMHVCVFNLQKKGDVVQRGQNDWKASLWHQLKSCV